jgi:6-phosphofructokinase 1
MENLDLKDEELRVPTLGTARINSPLNLSSVYGDNIANYIEDGHTVLLHHDRGEITDRLAASRNVPAFEKAGPRARIYFDPSKTRAAIVTCGGLCPGINNVIRELVRTLSLAYGVRTIFGIRYGYQGFIPEYAHEPMMLDPDIVDEIHEKGGSILSSSRGSQPTPAIVDCLERMNISVLFTIGGDGTLRAAAEIFEEVSARGLKIAVIGIPKTIDNDISYVQKTFGLDTAFSIAGQAIRAAHVESKGAPYGIGLVKVMGRLSGFIAANAALGLNEVNFVLIPEVPFDLEGSNGLFAALERRFQRKDHAVIIVAEGAGQRYLEGRSNDRDPSGNPILNDIGAFLRDAIKRYFEDKGPHPVNLKYIDPSYMVRAVPANAQDAVYCIRLAQNAAHAAMAGKTGMLVGSWNDLFTNVPLQLAASKKKTLSPEDPLWLNVLFATGQPVRMVNEAKRNVKVGR